MADTTKSLMDERRAIRDVLAAWWVRWEALYREQIGDGDAGLSLQPIDAWARETPEQTAARIAPPPAQPAETTDADLLNETRECRVLLSEILDLQRRTSFAA